MNFYAIIFLIYERIDNMKVQGLNSSSRKTKNLIKRVFAELINEKKELSKISVTELVKRADITRGTFYTHYDDIYEVAEEYQLETIDLLVSDDNILYTKNDILNYFSDTIKCLKDNEDIYKMLSSNDTLPFLEKLKKMSSQKILFALQNISKNTPYLELDVSFFIDGIINQLLLYFRDKSDYSLDELHKNIIKWFEKIFDL